MRDIGKTDLQQNTDAVRDRSGVRDSGEPEFYPRWRAGASLDVPFGAAAMGPG